jgi:hypothetical protein
MKLNKFEFDLNLNVNMNYSDTNIHIKVDNIKIAYHLFKQNTDLHFNEVLLHLSPGQSLQNYLPILSSSNLILKTNSNVTINKDQIDLRIQNIELNHTTFEKQIFKINDIDLVYTEASLNGLINKFMMNDSNIDKIIIHVMKDDMQLKIFSPHINCNIISDINKYITITTNNFNLIENYLLNNYQSFQKLLNKEKLQFILDTLNEIKILDHENTLFKITFNNSQIKINDYNAKNFIK